MEFRIEELIPDFIHRDRTGYALAKAMEAGLKYFIRVVEDGLKIMYSVEDMPEWRLDELAWETDFPFDYCETLEVKRKWINQALAYIPNMGTPAAVEEVLQALFEYVSISEPRWAVVTVHANGDYNADMKKKVRWTLERVQPLRNTVSSLTPAGLATIVYELKPSRIYKVSSPKCGVLICGVEEQL